MRDVVTHCPNCKHNSFLHKWILKAKQPIEKSIDEIAYDLMKEKQEVRYASPSIIPSSFLTASSISVNDELKDCIQLIIECKQCGYTSVYDVDKFRTADKI